MPPIEPSDPPLVKEQITPELHWGLTRYRVPGGWLYVAVAGAAPGELREGHWSVATTFVPDPVRGSQHAPA